MASDIRSSIEKATASSYSNTERASSLSSSTTTNLRRSSAARANTGPLARVSVTNIERATGATKTFSVTYADSNGINLRSIGSRNILVTAGNKFRQFARLVSPAKFVAGSKNTRAIATYSITARDRAWSANENGRYSISLQGRQVKDTLGAFAAPRKLKDFLVDVPTVSFVSGAITGPGEYTLRVNYRDRNNISLPRIDSADLAVSGGPTPLNVQFVSAEQGRTGTLATYRISAPDSRFDPDDYGTYSISLRANQVSDIARNFVQPGLIRSFTVNEAALPPIGLLGSERTIESGAQNHLFTVTYQDNGSVDATTLGTDDVRVTGPNGYNQLAEYVGSQTGANGLTATYRISAPGGSSWGADETGAYQVSLVANQIADNNGNTNVAATLGSIQVNPQSLRFEAETFTSDGSYFVERSVTTASGGRVLRVRQQSTPGQASRLFTGPSGTYNIVVGYFDENDGVAKLSVKINNTLIDSWNFDQNLGSTTATSQTFVERQIANGISVSRNSTINLEGIFAGGEAARVDYIEFIRV
ncbi:hypothetical protein H6F93_28870 [Leptolyngbya sp. FACHB-671]|uniref:hypothetical protein n=1 Tax=Leptolyngbya sp. FACHB-671 TaxID=2692812 RepID=UPI00168424F6|nr:hypothetical protein [Leptolyngbya sp. FACHB-671]MBD2071482.1 hypothetical protein [Leptolyngbya sp. FACHB-671]